MAAGVALYAIAAWLSLFFINGILTNGDVAQLNAACISYMFHRPVTLIQNATDGALADLLADAGRHAHAGRHLRRRPH